MNIAVDGMGGDSAPQAIVEGAVLAAQELNVKILLVGDEVQLGQELDRLQARQLPITVCHAPEVVDMGEAPGMALRRKRFSSIRVATGLVRRGDAQAVVSAGHTGAALAAASMILKPIQGIDRPAIATLLPTQKGHAILLDGGANVDCKASQLLQFGIMGHVFVQSVFHQTSPAVGLLAIGEEDTKGNEVTKEAFGLFKASDLNFLGNVEGKHFFQGMADVVVCDGFIGNVTLKMCEGLAEMYGKALKTSLTATFWRRLAAWFLRPALADIRQRVDASEYGGMPLIGVNGTCIIAHGGSTPKAIKNAIHMAKRMAEVRIPERIQEYLERRDTRCSPIDATNRHQRCSQLRNQMSYQGAYDFEVGSSELQGERPATRLPLL